MSAPGRRAALLINARSRAGYRTEVLAGEALRRHGLHLVRSVLVTSPRKLARAADDLFNEGIDRLIVGGGDGTLNTVAHRVAERKLILGVLPMGTANDFARTLHIPANLARAVEVAAGDTTLAVDLALANGKYFLNVASVGMSVAALGQLSPNLKRRFGPLAYAVAGARVFLDHNLFRFRLRGGDHREGMAHQVVVANGRFYGGGVLVDNDNTLDDGALSAYCLGMSSRWELLRTVVLQKMRIPLGRPGDAYLRASTLTVETWPSLPVNLDGEIRTKTPVEFSIEAQALRVLVPKND